jgi:hypothetical protein
MLRLHRDRAWKGSFAIPRAFQCGHIFGGQKIARIFPRKQSKPLGIANFPVLVEIGLDRNSSAFGNLKLPRSITHGDVF